MVTLTVMPGGRIGEPDRPPARGDVLLWWLGQAGFGLRFQDRLMMIDPYLSDHLAAKYAGTAFPHIRMMPPPVAPADVKGLDWCLCTHRHGDHMDPGTLPVLARGNPRCRFVLPRAEGARAVEIGVPAERRVLLDDGDRFEPEAGVSITAVAAAHETIERDHGGRCRCLGFVVRLGRIAVYHSGDCVPYEGLAGRLASIGVDVALLPVNGRDQARRDRGFAGNFTLEEAVALAQAAGAGHLVVHHFGMFAFNTADPRVLRARIREMGLEDRCLVPEVGQTLRLSPAPAGRA